MSQQYLPSPTHAEDCTTTSDFTTETTLVPDSQVSDATSSSRQTVQSGLESTNTNTSQSSITNVTMSTNPSQSQLQHSQPQIALETSRPQDIDKLFPRSFTPTTDSHEQGDSSISSPSSHSSGSPSQGSKRTSSGAVKMPSTTTNDVVGNQANAHAGPFVRKSSTGSRSSRISELSLQLKTRLTYAMIKVQNGWEQRSIDEVESLAASQLSSPVSTTSTMLRGSLQSPRLGMASTNGRLQDPYAPRDPHSQSRYRSTSSSRPGTANSAWPQQSPRMYDRYHAGPPVPTLAPAPELTTKSRHQRSDSKLSTTTTRTMRATTPTPQEQDAVDTLLFMSSPANSSRFTHNPAANMNINNAQGSPSRAQFAMPRRNLPGTGPPTLFDRASASSEEEVLLSTSSSKRGLTATTDRMQRQAKRRSYGRMETEKDVDRLLDQMRDVVSSSEEEAAGLAARRLNPVDVRM